MVFESGNGEITIPASLCKTRVDQLILGVESTNLEECVMYNNYMNFPIECKNQDGE